MIGRLESVVLDARDPHALATFYAALLGLPITEVEGDPPAWVDVGDEASGRLSFQRVPDHRPPRWSDPSAPQQFHLDITVDDIETAEPEVLALGARRLPWGSVEEEARGLRAAGPGGYRVYADPAGHPFCLCWDRAARQRARRWA